jgi:hypothetical protein
MRAEYAVTARSWVDKQPRVWLLASEAADFSAQLIRERELAPAIGLADSLLHVVASPNAGDAANPERTRRPEPIGRLDDYEFERVLKKVSAALIAADAWKAFTWSLAHLERTLELSERSSRIARRADSSAMWRPTIAAGAMHYGHDYANALVDAVRDAAVAAARASEDAHARVSRALRDSEWTVSRRIAIHVAKELTR